MSDYYLIYIVETCLSSRIQGPLLFRSSCRTICRNLTSIEYRIITSEWDCHILIISIVRYCARNPTITHPVIDHQW